MIFFRCSLPQFLNSFTTFSSDLPCSVILYSTLGGKVSNTVRLISWLASKSFNSFDKLLSVIPGISFTICLNRLSPKDKEIMIGSFQRPYNVSRASLTGVIHSAHSEGRWPFRFFSGLVCCVSMLPVHTIQMESAIYMDSAINPKVKIVIFVVQEAKKLK